LTVALPKNGSSGEAGRLAPEVGSSAKKLVIRGSGDVEDELMADVVIEESIADGPASCRSSVVLGGPVLKSEIELAAEASVFGGP
jgi:hypothetical protein